MKKIKLTIPKPCHEAWDGMTPVDKGRFCAACKKTVTDFTGMNDRQIAEFFKRPPSSLCGRFDEDQLNREIVIPRKRVPWIKYFFQISLPAFLVSLRTNAQEKSFLIGDTAVIKNQQLLQVKFAVLSNNIKELPKTVKGQVVNEHGVPVSFATIAVKNSSLIVSADENGFFEIKVPVKDESVLVATAIGFEKTEIIVRSGDVQKIQMKTISEIMQPVIVRSCGVQTGRYLTGLVGGISVYTYSSSPIARIKEVIDTAFRKFSVYPNPVQRNSSVKIDLKKFEAGNYFVSIINVGGSIVQATEVVVQSKKQVIKLPLKNIAAGTYFVRLINRQTAVSFSEKIIVQ